VDNKFSNAQMPGLARNRDGATMIDLHYWTTPNGHKITIFLEETGLAYRIIPVNIGKGQQFARAFLAIARTIASGDRRS